MDVINGIISLILYPNAPTEAVKANMPLYHLLYERCLSVYFCNPSMLALACFNSSHILLRAIIIFYLTFVKMFYNLTYSRLQPAYLFKNFSTSYLIIIFESMFQYVVSDPSYHWNETRLNLNFVNSSIIFHKYLFHFIINKHIPDKSNISPI